MTGILSKNIENLCSGSVHTAKISSVPVKQETQHTHMHACTHANCTHHTCLTEGLTTSACQHDAVFKVQVPGNLQKLAQTQWTSPSKMRLSRKTSITSGAAISAKWVLEIYRGAHLVGCLSHDSLRDIYLHNVLLMRLESICFRISAHKLQKLRKLSVKVLSETFIFIFNIMPYSNFLHKAIIFGFDLVSLHNRLLAPQELGWVSWKLLKKGKIILAYTFCVKFFLRWLHKFEICQIFTEIIIENVASDKDTCQLCSFKKGNSMYCMQMKKKEKKFCVCTFRHLSGPTCWGR